MGHWRRAFSRMLSFDVSTQIDFALKSARTRWAFKGFVTRVFLHMCDQIGRLRERFATDETLMRFLS